MEQNHYDCKVTGHSRILYFDILRILATFFVIVIHVSSQYWASVDIHSYEWRMMNLYDGISRWCVPVFVMISGALFLDRNITSIRQCKKYILRLVTSFLFWSLGYAALFFFFGKERSTVGFIRSVIEGYYHLWFVYMIIGLYLITPLLNRIVSDEKLLRYFLILSFVFAVVIPQSISVIRVFHTEYADWAESVINQAYLKLVLGYSFYYVLGYYLHKASISRKQSVIIYCCGIIGFLSTVIFTFIISVKKDEAIKVLYENFTVNVAIEAVAVFVLVKNCFSHRNIGAKMDEVIHLLSKYSYGTYLVHMFVVIILDKALGFRSTSFNTLIAIPAISIVVFVISYLISAILNHIPVLKRYIV